MANEKGIKLRGWSIHAEDYEAAEDFRAVVAQELAQFEHMGERLGVGFVCAPVREEQLPGVFKTVGWVFQTETIPAAASWHPDPIELGEENIGSEAVEA